MLQKIIFIFLINSFIGNGFLAFALDPTDKLAVEYKKEDTLKINNLNSTGRDLIIKGDYLKADSLISDALALSEKINFKNGMYNALLNKGVTFWYQDNYPKALEHLIKALEISEQLNNKLFMSRALANIGLIYAGKNDYKNALGYYHRAMNIKKEIGDQKAVAILLSNIARIYGDMKDDRQSLEYYLRSLKANEEVENNNGLVALNYVGIGSIYKGEGDLLKAKYYYTNAFRMADSLNDKILMSSTLINIGILDFAEQDYSASELNLKHALQIAIDLGSVINQRDAYHELSKLYEKQNKWELSLLNYRNYIKTQDSVLNESNTKRIVKLEMNYEFDKKDAISRSEQEKKEAVVKTESKKKQIIIWSACGILILVMIFAIYIYLSYKEKQKINIEITQQKHIIEEKQNEILDSIYYAKRIQTALITSEKYIDRNLNKLNNKK